MGAAVAPILTMPTFDTLATAARMTGDLFEGTAQPLAPGAALLRAFARDRAGELVDAAHRVMALAPLRHMVTPGGLRMSVAMTNCGPLGWVSDRRGYRYVAHDPLSGEPWPEMPEAFRAVALDAAARVGFPDFLPDACLINRYVPGTRLSLHQDRDETDLSAPIVSVSLGLPAVFLFGGLRRADRPRRLALEHGDVVVWGGPSRLVYHGVAPLASGLHRALGEQRINLTFRKAR